MHQCKVYFNIDLPYDKEKFHALLKQKISPKELKAEDISVLHFKEVEKELQNNGLSYKTRLHSFQVNTNEDYEVYVSDMVRDVIVPFVGKENWLLHEFIAQSLDQFIDELAAEITKQDIMNVAQKE